MVSPGCRLPWGLVVEQNFFLPRGFRSIHPVLRKSAESRARKIAEQVQEFMLKEAAPASERLGDGYADPVLNSNPNLGRSTRVITASGRSRRRACRD
jgi:hypothetical protein